MEKKSADLFRKASAKRSERHPLDNFKREDTESKESIENEPKEIKPVVTEVPDDKPVRQSFLLDMATMEKIKDIVYYERRNGNFEYSQKDVIIDGIKALLEERGDVPERPAEERVKEKNRSERIKKAKRKTRY
jgi:hypothetical protein